MKLFSARVSDGSREERDAYAEVVNTMTLDALVVEFLSYLDYVEATDSGQVFHPITIRSVRCLATEPLSMVLQAMRRATRLPESPSR